MTLAMPRVRIARRIGNVSALSPKMRMNQIPGGSPHLLQELPIAKGDVPYPRLMASLAKAALLILDDWGLATLSDENRRDVIELLEDRHGRGATLVTSQFPVEHWHDAIEEPTLADAILDRLLHNVYKITLRGDSMRKRHAIVKHDVPAL